jgi:FAD/FMN-containing dehydrogenase
MDIRDLEKKWKGRIATDDATRNAASRDYSIFERKPSMVLIPEDADDVARAVQYVLRHNKTEKTKLSLTARAAGTDMTGGPLTESIAVSTTEHMHHIREWGKDYAIVEPGLYYRDFEREATARGLFFPSYPASKDLCAWGGIVANNSGGEKTLRYGKTARYVEQITAVLGDGKSYTLAPLTKKELEKKKKGTSFEARLYRGLFNLIHTHEKRIKEAKPDTSKNSSGYALWDVWDGETFDITKVFVGSQGTLGLWTDAKVKLLPIPKYRQMTVIFLRDLSLIPSIVAAVMPFEPESFESYDDKTLSVALRLFPDLVRRMKTGLIHLALQFIPEAMMVLRGGLPKLVLLVEFAGDEAHALKQKAEKLKGVLDRFPVVTRVLDGEAEAEKYWTIRRQSFALLHDKGGEESTTPFIDDIIVRPEYLPEFLPAVNRILEPHKDKMVYTIAGHVGDGNFHIIPLMDLRNPEVRAIIPLISEKIYALVKKYNGSMTAEHNDGLIRTPYLPFMFGKDMVQVFEKTKHLFDPQGIFNPGKKVGGTLAGNMAFMRRKNR